MTRRRSALGLFGRFGRSGDLRQLDEALKRVDLHPALVPEGAKLTIVNLMKDHAGEDEPPPHAYAGVAEIFGYCVLGPDAFGRVNGESAVRAAEERVEQALEAEESFDAQLVLLALHARLISPRVVELFGLSAEED
ncbi:hypothetical protein [Aquamicrobium sp. LC103]|uniref:hypothetical protein n=1 Tax=Aquamicrobium sp. LC103 TaxID=1120658 RepID=UPI00069B31EF|nr:hypothetical protein [Aquamicrobium sp. LC103]TKT74263.1 hypothetical protein XW59_024970 [Aquamicrobium sp. LC103]